MLDATGDRLVGLFLALSDVATRSTIEAAPSGELIRACDLDDRAIRLNSTTVSSFRADKDP
ncbi:MAG: hypothetical protein HYV63_01930 [Candidatus Schekmanbacteria bacterium]|nr:hypothetical protein [Candidatus Schekmanbacteria bacterium]